MSEQLATTKQRTVYRSSTVVGMRSYAIAGMRAARMQVMTKLETIPTDQLALATGGAGMGNIDLGGIINTIGGLVGSFDKSGKASQIIGAIGPLIQQFMGKGGQQEQQAQPQAQGGQAGEQQEQA
jgi:hypothetical protein